MNSTNHLEVLLQQWLVTMDHWVVVKMCEPGILTLLTRMARRATEQDQPLAWLRGAGMVTEWPPKIPWDESWIALVEQWHDVARIMWTGRTLPCRRGIIAGTRDMPQTIPWIDGQPLAVIDTAIGQYTEDQITIQWTWTDEHHQFAGEWILPRSDLTQSAEMQGQLWAAPWDWRQTAPYYWWASPTQSMLPVVPNEPEYPAEKSFEDLVAIILDRIQTPHHWLFATGHRMAWSAVLQQMAEQLAQRGTSTLWVKETSDDPKFVLQKIRQGPHAIWLWDNWRGQWHLSLPQDKSGIVVFHAGRATSWSIYQWPLVPPGNQVVYVDLIRNAQHQLVLTDEQGSQTFGDTSYRLQLLNHWFSCTAEPRQLWQPPADSLTSVWSEPKIIDLSENDPVCSGC